ncbi:MAG: sugar kinase [Vampirovibrionales bacterium]|nr:sugar kinase [Vampirovibrionales bacterium]
MYERPNEGPKPGANKMHALPMPVVIIGEPLTELLSRESVQSEFEFTKRYSGDVLTTAVAVARQTIPTSLVTRLAADPFGQGIADLLAKENISWPTQRFMETQGPQGCSTGLVIRARGNADVSAFVYYRKNSASALLCPDDLPENAFSPKTPGILFASGISMAISESARKTVLHGFKHARAAGWTTVFDPNYRPDLWQKTSKYLEAMAQILPLTDVLSLSTPGDCRPLCNLTQPEQVLDYLSYQGVPLVILKAADEGCYIRFRGETMTIPAYWPESLPPAIGSLDAIGAGDAFNGGLIAGLAQRQSLLACAQRGVITAGLYLYRQQGLSELPTRDELNRLLEPANIRSQWDTGRL